MEQGWQCPKCNNIYAPNTPFCLYCWFQSQKASPVNHNFNSLILQSQQEKITQNDKDVSDNIDEKKSIINYELQANKDLTLEPIDITIPVLNKKSDAPLPNKWPDTKIFLGGIGHSKERAINRKFIVPYILDSIFDFPVQPSKLVRQYFDYIKTNKIEYLLDSGAFSYMNNPKKTFNLKNHLKQYCYYINEFDIKNFFELDLDIFMSLEEIENVRRKIFLETHKQPIIVFHQERKAAYWTKMCKENAFIAIGGLVTGNNWYSAEGQRTLLEMCDEAHSYGTLVHGLGFTPLTLLNSHTMFFDTIDSTTWNVTKRGCTAEIGENGNLLKLDGTNYFSAVEGQEHDLEVWAQFALNYRGALRN